MPILGTPPPPGRWSRIWVVQEIAVGTAITIQYGTIALSWDALVSTANVWSLPRARQMAASMGIESENLKVFTLFADQLNGLEQTRRKWRAKADTTLSDFFNSSPIDMLLMTATRSTVSSVS